MTAGGCPHCGAPYRKTVSADEDSLGELALPDEGYAAVCYNVRARPKAYLGFTLYFHPATVHAIETRPEGIEDGEREGESKGELAEEEWSHEDVYASRRSRRSRCDRALATEA
jgi:hypothetical protein